MDTEDNGADRQPGDARVYLAGESSTSEAAIRAEAGWRGDRAPPGAAVRPKRSPTLHQDTPTEAVIVGSSRKARELRDRIKLYADDISPVLITGETGSGKELVARELHRLSDRRSKPFVPLNAGAIPEGVASTELFGHTKGAFTSAVSDRDGAFQLADGGVLLIDEIGDMPASIQAQLLRVLDDGVVTRLGARSSTKVDFRLVAATNVDLRRNVSAGSFRRDLYHRITVLQIDVPPLRDRTEDIAEIVEALIRAHPRPEHRGARLTPLAADKLASHTFPGNVRELRNIVFRAIVHARGGKILTEHLVFPESNGSPGEPASLDISEAKELIGRLIVLKALKQTGGNVTRAAALTGRTRSTFHTLKKQLDGEDFASQYEAVCARIRALIDAC